ERKHLGERVMYNEATDTLVIKGIPPSLKDQLQRFMEQDES
ncbi:MAG: nucleoid-associated protein, partial [Colwellia sp.]